jgi:hypothetical protein
MYLATVILDNLIPREANSAAILGLPYRCFESKQMEVIFSIGTISLLFLIKV